MKIRQQNKDKQAPFQIDRWQSSEDHRSIEKKMEHFSRLSKQKFYHFDKPLEIQQKAQTNAAIETPKAQFEKTKSNLLSPLETKTTRLHLQMHDASLPSVRHRRKRNLSFEFNYLTHHQNENLTQTTFPKIMPQLYEHQRYLPKVYKSEKVQSRKRKSYFEQKNENCGKVVNKRINEHCPRQNRGVRINISYFQ